MKGSKPFTPIEQLDFYVLFDEISDWACDAVVNWPLFAQRTFGEQLVRAADSVVANLVEGDGRSGAQDAIRFFIMARASARETKMWLKKAQARKLVGQEDVEVQLEKIIKAARLLNLFIQYRRDKAIAVKEGRTTYSGGDPLVERIQLD